MEQLKKMTIRTTVGGAAQFYALCIELLVSASSLDQLLPTLVVKELVLRLGRYGANPLMAADNAAKIVLSPAEALAVRSLILSETMPSSMESIARKVMAIIDPQLPVLERLVRPKATLPPEPAVDELA